MIKKICLHPRMVHKAESELRYVWEELEDALSGSEISTGRGTVREALLKDLAAGLEENLLRGPRTTLLTATENKLCSIVQESTAPASSSGAGAASSSSAEPRGKNVVRPRRRLFGLMDDDVDRQYQTYERN